MRLLKNSGIIKYDRRRRAKNIRSVATVMINLTYPKKIILDSIEKLIDSRKITDKRAQFGMYDSYLAIYDMREKGEKYEIIAEKIYPQEAYKNINSAIRKVHRGFKEAKKLIMNKGLLW